MFFGFICIEVLWYYVDYICFVKNLGGILFLFKVFFLLYVWFNLFLVLVVDEDISKLGGILLLFFLVLCLFLILCMLMRFFFLVDLDDDDDDDLKWMVECCNFELLDIDCLRCGVEFLFLFIFFLLFELFCIFKLLVCNFFIKSFFVSLSVFILVLMV